MNATWEDQNVETEGQELIYQRVEKATEVVFRRNEVAVNQICICYP
jgi:hypothetical protein